MSLIGYVIEKYINNDAAYWIFHFVTLYFMNCTDERHMPHDIFLLEVYAVFTIY